MRIPRLPPRSESPLGALRAGSLLASFVILPVLASITAAPLASDILHLENGRRLEGDVIEQTAETVTFMASFGQMTIPAGMVARIEHTPSLHRAVEAALANLPEGDADAVYELALYCREKGAETRARRLLERVLAIDPDHAGAHQALGHVRVGNRWLSEREARLARGEVEYRGRWMSAREARALQVRDALAAERRRREQQRRRLEEERAERRHARELELVREVLQATASPYAPYGAGGGPGPTYPGWGIPVVVPPPPAAGRGPAAGGSPPAAGGPRNGARHPTATPGAAPQTRPPARNRSAFVADGASAGDRAAPPPSRRSSRPPG